MEAFPAPGLSPSPSLGDFGTPDGLGQRIRRKPPPIVESVDARDGGRSPFLLQDREERYPTPDPKDPFAPLWVLRQRTSSAALWSSNDSRDTLDTLLVSPHIFDTADMDQSASYYYTANDMSRPSTPRTPNTLKKTPKEDEGEQKVASPSRASVVGSPKPIGHYTPYSQKHAFPSVGRSDTPHIFTSPGPTPLRQGISDIRMPSARDSGDANGDSDASSACELAFRPLINSDSFERPFAQRPSSSGSSAPGESKQAPATTPHSPARDTTRHRFKQLKALLRPMGIGKRSLSVSLPFPSPVASKDLAPRPMGANLGKITPRPVSSTPFAPTAPRPVTDLLNNNDDPFEKRARRNREFALVEKVRRNGLGGSGQRIGGHQHQNRSLSMGSGHLVARDTTGPSKTEHGTIIDSTSRPKIARVVPHGPSPQDGSSTFRNTTPAESLRPENSHAGNNLLSNAGTCSIGLANEDGLDDARHHSHDSCIIDTSLRTKSGTSSDLLVPRTRRDDEGRRPWLTQEGSLPPQSLPPPKVEHAMQAQAITQSRRPTVTFAPPKSPTQSNARRSMKASFLATVFATTARRAVVSSTEGTSLKEDVGAATGGEDDTSLQTKRSKWSSMSSASSSSSGSMVFANTDYVVPSQTLRTHKISAPEPSPTFSQTMGDDTFASPRPAPQPPARAQSRQTTLSLSPKPVLLELSPRSEPLGSPTQNYGTDSLHVPQGTIKSSRKPINKCDQQSRRCVTQDPGVSSPNADKSFGVQVDNLPPGEWALPTPAQLSLAAKLSVKGEDGQSVQFGTLFSAHRTIVVFIRHFWCPLCQDYMASLRAIVKPEMLARPRRSDGPGQEAAPKRPLQAAPKALRRSVDQGDPSGRPQVEQEQLVGFVVIGNGAPAMIKKYRQIFALPFAVYSDPELDVYRALGMGKDGGDGHRHLSDSVTRARRASMSNMPNEPTSPSHTHTPKPSKKDPSYVKHGLVGGIAMVVVRALKVGMPVWEKGGDIAQLGGEFIFGPGLTCSFAHRMQTTKGHAPIENVLQAAGIDISATSQEPTNASESSKSPSQTGRRRHNSLREPTSADYKRATLIRRGDDLPHSTGIMSPEDEDAWMSQRQQQLEALYKRKLARRGAPRQRTSLEVETQVEGATLEREHGLEAVGEVSEEFTAEDHFLEDNEMRRLSIDTAGVDADDEDDMLDDDTRSENAILMDEIHRCLRSMSDLRVDDYAGSDEEDSIRDPESMLSDTEGGLFSKEDHEWPIPPTHTPSPREIASF